MSTCSSAQENIAYGFHACLVYLTSMVYEMGGKCPYSCCFVGYVIQNLFKTPRSIIKQFPSSFFYGSFSKVYVVQPYSSTEMATALKNPRFISLGRSDFHIVDDLTIAVYAFHVRMLTLLSVNAILLTRYVKWSIGLQGLPFNVLMAPSSLKHFYSFLFEAMQLSECTYEKC